MINAVKGRILATVAVASLLAGAATAWADLTPEAGSPYATGNAPYTVYTADFDGDGRPDIASGNGDAGTASVFLRQPAGGFAEESGSPFQTATSNGTIGDFNGDGRPDLAFGDYTFSQGIAVLLRSPSGGFTRETTPFSERLGALGAGDFNRDGRVDLAVARYDNQSLTILLRNPNSDGFTFGTSPGTGAQPRQIAVADFNGDAFLDLAVANFASANVTILLGGGDGTFVAEGAAVAVGGAPAGIAAADFNGDGRPDLAVSNSRDGTVSVLMRDAANTGFVQAAGSPIAVTAGPASVATGDFDRNGSPDIAVAANGGALEILRSGPAGFTRDAPIPLTGIVSGVAVADFNGDTVPDAAVTSYGTNQLHVLLSPSPPVQPPPAPTPTPTAAPAPPPPAATPVPPPVANRIVNAEPVSGKVRVKLPNSNRYIDLAQARQLPNGTSIDTRDGRVTITAAAAGNGKTDQADFFDGLFKIAQTKLTTTLTLTEALDCKKTGKASAAAKKPKTRKLWGDGKGKFRTRGQYAAATVRGTQWLVQDGCGYTRVTVKQGSVSARDEVKNKTAIVRKGRSYVARAKKNR